MESCDGDEEIFELPVQAEQKVKTDDNTLGMAEDLTSGIFLQYHL